MNVQDCTSVYKGEQECIRVNTAVHGFTRLYMGTWVYNSLHVCTRLQMDIGECTWVYKALQVLYKGV